LVVICDSSVNCAISASLFVTVLGGESVREQGDFQMISFLLLSIDRESIPFSIL